MHRMTRTKWNQKFGNLLKYYKQFLPYKYHQLQHNALQEVLPNLRKQISLICLLSILKISQIKRGFRFIVVSRISPQHNRVYS
jgi:hypothetical protein